MKKIKIVLVLLILSLNFITLTLIKGNYTIASSVSVLKGSNSSLSSKAYRAIMGDETVVNGDTTGTQNTPAICSRYDDSFIIAWTGVDVSGTAVFTKIFNSTGYNQTDDIQVNNYTTGSQQYPSICSRADGSFLIVWSGNSNLDTNGVYLKIFNETGDNETDDILVNSYTNNVQSAPDISCFENGSFIVTWHSFGQDADGYGVFMKIFNSTGHNQTDDIQVNTNTTGFQTSPRICCINDSHFIIAWDSDGQDGSDYGVYCKIFDSTCTNITDDIQVNTYTTLDQENADICCFDNGDFIIVWEGVGVDDDSSIYVKLFNSTGAPQTGDIRVNSYVNNAQLRPAICCYPDGSFAVTWDSFNQDGSQAGVYAKYFSSTGIARTGDIQINEYTQYGQQAGDICCQANHSFVITYSSYGIVDFTEDVCFRIGSFEQRPSERDNTWQILLLLLLLLGLL